MDREAALLSTPPRRKASPASCAAELDDELAGLPEADPSDTALRVVTWNVWFDQRARFRRWSALLREALATSPHIVCLQEVTPELSELIAASTWLAQRFQSSPALQHGYDVLTLVRRDLVVRWRSVAIPTTLGRRCLVAEVSAAIDPPACLGVTPPLAGVVRVANVHLESMEYNAGMRAQQLDVLFPAIDPSIAAEDGHVHLTVLCGDFNFCSSWDENEQVLQSGFDDVWAQLRQHEPGYTEDTERNAMLLEAKGKLKQVRFDRVLLRISQAMSVGKGCAESIQLLGTEPLAEELWPSDHFGLFTRIAV